MYVSIINAETSNHMIHEKEAAKCEGIFGTANSAVILENGDNPCLGESLLEHKRLFAKILHRHEVFQVLLFGLRLLT